MSSQGRKVRTDLDHSVHNQDPSSSGESVQELEGDGFFFFVSRKQLKKMPKGRKLNPAVEEQALKNFDIK